MYLFYCTSYRKSLAKEPRSTFDLTIESCAELRTKQNIINFVVNSKIVSLLTWHIVREALLDGVRTRAPWPPLITDARSSLMSQNYCDESPLLTASPKRKPRTAKNFLTPRTANFPWFTVTAPLTQIFNENQRCSVLRTSVAASSQRH